MLSDGCCLLASISDLLSHTHFTERMLIMPDRASVPRTAIPAANPPNSDWYDVMSRGSPSSGPPPVSSISYSAVLITQLWYPTPNKTGPSVAAIRSFGSVVSHTIGVARVGMLPTKRWRKVGSKNKGNEDGVQAGTKSGENGSSPMQVEAMTLENGENRDRTNATVTNDANAADRMKTYNAKTGFIEVRLMTGNSKG
jgi:hypothetical protein